MFNGHLYCFSDELIVLICKLYLEAVTHICKLTQGKVFEASCFKGYPSMGQKKHYSENCIVISAVKFINLLSEDNTGVILTVLILNTTCVEFLMLKKGFTSRRK